MAIDTVLRSAAAFDAAVRAACPAIAGVAIGDPADKTTWRIDFADEATKDERAAAQAVLAAFDPAAPENQPAPRDVSAELDALKAALVKKALVTEAEIEARKAAVTVARADFA